MKVITYSAALLLLVNAASASKQPSRNLRALSDRNHPVCLQILDSWWSLRETMVNDNPEVTAFDEICQAFQGDQNACRYRTLEARQAYVDSGAITEDQVETPCTMLGANSDTCTGNPCNFYNIGECTLQATGGLCNWWTQEQANEFGVEYGCHRNPCHLGGQGQAADECNDLGVEGLYQCTWCYGDGALSGLGMGCQREDEETTAACAPINDGSVPQNSIWQLRSNTNCQCSDEINLCKDAVNGPRSSDFERRF